MYVNKEVNYRVLIRSGKGYIRRWMINKSINVKGFSNYHSITLNHNIFNSTVIKK